MFTFKTKLYRPALERYFKGEYRIAVISVMHVFPDFEINEENLVKRRFFINGIDDYALFAKDDSKVPIFTNSRKYIRPYYIVCHDDYCEYKGTKEDISFKCKYMARAGSSNSMYDEHTFRYRAKMVDDEGMSKNMPLKTAIVLLDDAFDDKLDRFNIYHISLVRLQKYNPDTFDDEIDFYHRNKVIKLSKDEMVAETIHGPLQSVVLNDLDEMVAFSYSDRDHYNFDECVERLEQYRQPVVYESDSSSGSEA